MPSNSSIIVDLSPKAGSANRARKRASNSARESGNSAWPVRIEVTLARYPQGLPGDISDFLRFLRDCRERRLSMRSCAMPTLEGGVLDEIFAALVCQTVCCV